MAQQEQEPPIIQSLDAPTVVWLAGAGLDAAHMLHQAHPLVRRDFVIPYAQGNGPNGVESFRYLNCGGFHGGVSLIAMRSASCSPPSVG